jgi:hypothetical protein
MPCPSHPVNSSSAICDQKTSKFFVFHVEASRQDTGCEWSLLKVREGELVGPSWWTQVESGGRKSISLLQVLFRFILIYGKGETR